MRSRFIKYAERSDICHRVSAFYSFVNSSTILTCSPTGSIPSIHSTGISTHHLRNILDLRNSYVRRMFSSGHTYSRAHPRQEKGLSDQKQPLGNRRQNRRSQCCGRRTPSRESCQRCGPGTRIPLRMLPRRETGGPDLFVLIERNLTDIYGINEWNADFPETVDVSFYNRNMRNNLAFFPSITEIWST